MRIVSGTMYIAVSDANGMKLIEWKNQCLSTTDDDEYGEVRCTHQRGHAPVLYKGSFLDHGTPALGHWWNDL